jgi:hypothetical protein
MQDTMRRGEIRRLQGLQGADIQDTIRLRLEGLLAVLARPGVSDMQDASPVYKRPW